MQIKGFSQHNSYVYGNILESQYSLRHRVFAERQRYDVPTFNNMEYDAYDTPATVYFTWENEHGEVLGVSRVKPTDRPYMIKDIWPELVETIDLPESIKVWESSRFGIDRSLDSNLRKQITGALVCANMEYALLNGIDYYVGIMHPRIWKAVFENSGWKVEFLGEPRKIEGGDRVVAAKMPVSFEILKSIKKTMGFTKPVLVMPKEKQFDEESVA